MNGKIKWKNDNKMISKIKTISSVRWIRMAIGLFFVFAGYGEKKWGVIAIGMFIFTQGLMDWGCGFRKNSCGTLDTKASDVTDFNADKAIKKINR
jgi:hypothetical protein